jgi:hypothetical protein
MMLKAESGLEKIRFLLFLMYPQIHLNSPHL